MLATVKPSKEPIVHKLDGKGEMQVWPFPLDAKYLEEFLTDIFENYWDQIIFGPLIEGAAYELTCPSKPSKVSFFDGYLTVNFGGPHFHLCIGETKGSKADPTPQDLKARRRPSKAQIYRKIDKHGSPISWGFEMRNGADQPMISIFFASPFLTGDKISKETNWGISKEPNWEKLAMWRDISKRYLDREPEQFDQSGRGYAAGGHG